MTPSTTGLIILVVLLLAMAVLFIQKITVARALRIIGCAFIAAGDAVDHARERLQQLKGQERATRSEA